MILAAGRGDRMRPLTDTCPKPLLIVHGKPLMQWAMEALARGGFNRVLVNTAWLGEKISHRFGHQMVWPDASPIEGSPANSAQLLIDYSHEGSDFGGALETAGGIVRALPKLDDVFWVLAGDTFAPGFVFSEATLQRFADSGKLAHLWLVANPPHKPNGDFGLLKCDSAPAGNGQLAVSQADVQYTYSTIGLYRRALFAPPYCDIAPGNPQGVKAPLAPILRAAMDQAQITAELYTGEWTDVGTPERLARLNRLCPNPN